MKYTIKNLKSRLKKSRANLADRLGRLVKRRPDLDEEFLEEIEEILIEGDVGVELTGKLTADLRNRIGEKKVDSAESAIGILKEDLVEILRCKDAGERVPPEEHPHVILIAGVNGVGKTTTIGKIAYRLKREGKNVLLAAGDTFRAAATEQLVIWAERAGCEIVKQQEGADPASVAYDALSAAISRDKDVLVIDTAGRLHTRRSLMDELRKISRVLDKKLPGAPHETLLVLDANMGQNALSQAKLFNEALDLDGIVLAKLDGTAKGGIVLAIAHQLSIPVTMVGLGEGLDDLGDFHPEEFVEALFEIEDLSGKAD